MSRFSGKCDIYDAFVMIPNDIEKTKELIEKTDFYIPTSDSRNHKLDIHNYFNLIPYFPYIESFGTHSTEKSVTVLSSRSYVDREEEEMFSSYLDQLKKIWRKCKKNKIPFDKEQILNDMFPFKKSKEYVAIVEYVERTGSKADMEDLKNLNIHSSHAEYYRTLLYEEMVNNGYDDMYAYKWCFNEFLPRTKKRLYKYETD